MQGVPHPGRRINMGSLTTANAIIRKFFGFEEGRLLLPPILNFPAASAAVKPLCFSETEFKFKL